MSLNRWQPDRPSFARSDYSVMPPQAIPVVYVAGSGHSGSTLLALLLDSHPDIACVGETAVKPKIRRRGDSASAMCSCGVTIAECPYWATVFEHVRQLGQDLSPESWTNDYRFEHPLAQRLLHRACSSATGRQVVTFAADHLPVYRNRVRRIDEANLAFIRAVLMASRARVFADTSKYKARLVHMLRVTALDLKLVHLVRDVRGYAASAKKRGMSPVDAARTWRRDQLTVDEEIRRRPLSPFHRVRYEDLCVDPDSTLRRLWAFCGVANIRPPVVVDAAAHHVLGNSMRMGGSIRIRLDESWKSQLTPDEVQHVLAVAGDLNTDLGFR